MREPWRARAPYLWARMMSMTSDDDRVAYLAGEEGDRASTTDGADLDELRALLGDELWAEPARSPRRRHRRRASLPRPRRTAGAVGSPRHAPPDAPAHPGDRVPDLRTSSRRLRVALGAAAAIAALAVAGVIVTRSGGDDRHRGRPRADELPDASGTATAHRTDSGWRIELDATGLPRLDDGEFYQAWLRGADDVLVADRHVQRGHRRDAVGRCPPASSRR